MGFELGQYWAYMSTLPDKLKLWSLRVATKRTFHLEVLYNTVKLQLVQHEINREELPVKSPKPLTPSLLRSVRRGHGDRSSNAVRAETRSEDLFKAAETGDSSALKSLSQKQLAKAFSLRNEDGRSVLHVAVSSGRSEVVKLLIAADESSSVINSTDEDGWAPLHSAASIGNSEIVELLLSKGADVNLKNNGGRSALHYAASKGWFEITQSLISHGANVNLKDKVGCTPLHWAASTAKSELCELLIEEAAEVDAVDRAGQTPLMGAVICDNKEVSLLLIRQGADEDVEDKVIHGAWSSF